VTPFKLFTLSKYFSRAGILIAVRPLSPKAAMRMTLHFSNVEKPIKVTTETKRERFNLIFGIGKQFRPILWEKEPFSIK
jgi:hypothetical protein